MERRIGNLWRKKSGSESVVLSVQETAMDTIKIIACLGLPLFIVVVVLLNSRLALIKCRRVSKVQWTALFPNERDAAMGAILEIVAEAFCLKKEDAFRLRPNDTMRGLYTDPNDLSVDTGPFEYLEALLEERLNVKLEEGLIDPDKPLHEFVSDVIARARQKLHAS